MATGLDQLDTQHVLSGEVADVDALQTVVQNVCRNHGYRTKTATLDASGQSAPSSFGRIEGEVAVSKSRTDRIPTFDPSWGSRSERLFRLIAALTAVPPLVIGIALGETMLTLAGGVLAVLGVIGWTVFAIDGGPERYDDEITVVLDGDRSTTSSDTNGVTGPVATQIRLGFAGDSQYPYRSPSRVNDDIESIVSEVDEYLST